MRIAYLLESTVLCGGVKVVLDHARLLHGRGHRVSVLSKDAGPAWYEVPFPLLQVPEFRPEFIPDSDFIIATYWTTVEAAYRAGRGIPLHFCQGYEGDFPENHPLREAIDAFYRLPVAKLAVSPHLSRLIETRFGQPCHLIGQGIDLAQFSPSPLPPSDGIPRLLLVGPLEVGWKGIADGLRAVQRAKARRPDLELVRVSQLPLSEWERGLGVVDRYHCHVAPREMPDLYRSVQLFLSPSRAEEGFGLPALEAMACGVPAILTAIPSYLSLDASKDFASFVPPGDPEAMAGAVLALLDDAPRRRVLATRGQAVASRYSLERVVDRLEATLAGLFGRKARERMARPPVEVVLLSGSPETSMEDHAAVALCRDSLLECSGKDAPIQILHPSACPTVGDLLSMTRGERLVVIQDDRTVFNPGWLDRLLETAHRNPHAAAVGPVANASGNAPQLRGSPYPYFNRRGYYRHTLSAASAGGEEFSVERLDLFCLLTRRDLLAKLPVETPVASLNDAIAGIGFPLLVEPKVYLHRFEDFYVQLRPDLHPIIPTTARRILDVGCAKGELGAFLRERQGAYVAGIELEPHAARVAASRLDLVVNIDVEQSDLVFDAPFDCIICGELLEHLRNPWRTLERLRGCLAPGGVFIASLPNAQHWSILVDLIEGRWEYLPVGLLCITHIRFFTRQSAIELFTRAGLSVEAVHPTIFEVAPEEYQPLLDALQKVNFAVDREAILASNYTIVARNS